MRFFLKRPFTSFPALNSLLSPSVNGGAANSLLNPNSSGATLTTLQGGNSPRQVMSHFVQTLTKNGQRKDAVLAHIHAKLKMKYGVENPIHTAVESVKPVLKYQKFKNSKHYVPIVLHPKSSEGIAIRWIIQAGSKRQYQGKKDLERGLLDEIDGILQGNSTVYQKRTNFHRNPN